MSAWYELSGIIQVKASPEAKAIADRYDSFGRDDMTAVYTVTDDPTIATVEFSGGSFMGFATVEELDNIAKELAGHVTGPQFLTYTYDNDHGRLYIGSESDEAIAKSADSLTEIKRLLPFLSDDDRYKLKAIVVSMDNAQAEAISEDGVVTYQCPSCGHEFEHDSNEKLDDDIKPGYVVCPECETVVKRPIGHY